MLKLQKKIKYLEKEINLNKLLLINNKKQLKKKLLTTNAISIALLLCFSAGCYLQYKKSKDNYSLLSAAKNAILTVFAFYSKLIVLLYP